MHYIIIIIVILVVVYLQIKIFRNTQGKLLVLKDIFPEKEGLLSLAYVSDNHKLIESKRNDKNAVFDVIISSINNYLKENKNVISDFHIIKDIVDRNCDAKEEEINVQIPIPLYLGLAGTMLGILFGLGYLVLSGGIADLLSSNSSGSGTEGVEALLGGVGLAMISSVVGIVLTTWGSLKAKDAKMELEKEKNIFLSWIEEVLLPKTTSDISSAIISMTRNLAGFNEAFAKNTNELRSTLSYVNDSYQKQTELMQSISNLKIGQIATANIEVYEKLKNSTNEIGIFAQYLTNVNEYLSNIKDLNKKLDEYEKRTQVIERAGEFFQKNEKWLAESFDNANIEVQKSLEGFNNTIKQSFSKLEENLNSHTLDIDKSMEKITIKIQDAFEGINEIINTSVAKNLETFEKAIAEQQIAFQNKSKEMLELIEELKNLKSIKEGIKDFKEATNKQNSKIEELTKEIRKLATMKIEGNTSSRGVRLPLWGKILIISSGGLVSLACLIYIIPNLINWFKILINWLF
ncbi:MAG TPA: hypothetical protein PLK41_06975 [Defluviitoga tunisiensis]|nr:hypothetical protein [Defluviitoga tunisiensis]